MENKEEKVVVCECGEKCVCMDGCMCGEDCSCEACMIISEDIMPEEFMCDCGNNNYKIVIEIDGNKFSFQSSDRETLEDVGLKLLPSAFGRFEEAVKEIID